MGIAEPDGNHVWVTDHSGSVSSVPDLLEERLDQCWADRRDLRLERTSTSRPSAAGPLSPQTGRPIVEANPLTRAYIEKHQLSVRARPVNITSSVSKRTASVQQKPRRGSRPFLSTQTALAPWSCAGQAAGEVESGALAGDEARVGDVPEERPNIDSPARLGLQRRG